MLDFEFCLYYYFLGIILVGVEMLVSSIGYFDVSKPYCADNATKNQTPKINLTEGFGHFNEKKQTQNNDSNLLVSFVNSFKSLFNKEKSQDSSKYLSLIA